MTWGLPIAVLFASLAGSPHCGGMCGPFLMLAMGTTRGRQESPGSSSAGLLIAGEVSANARNADGGGSRSPSRLSRMALYHCGRLASYLLLAVLGWAVGSLLNQGGQVLGWQQTAALIAGVVMVLVGGVGLGQAAGWRVSLEFFPSWFRRLLQAGHRQAARLHPLLRAFAVGLLTTWLPCGWLYAFVLTAAGTGRLDQAMVVMVAFWLGTLPLLSVVGLSWDWLTARWRTAMPLVSAASLILVGCLCLAGRAQANFTRLEQQSQAAGSTIERLTAVTADTPPCCVVAGEAQSASADCSPAEAPATAPETRP